MLTAQGVVLSGDAGGAVVQVANAQVAAAERDHRAGAETKTFGAEDGGFDDVEAGFEAAVHLQAHFMAQVVFHQGLLCFGQAQFPRRAAVFHAGNRRGAGAAVVTGNGNQVGIGFGHAGGDGTDAGQRHQFYRNQRFGVDLFEVENQLRQVFNRVNVVVRRRGNQGGTGHGIAQLGDIGGDFVTGQLAAFAGFRALRHFNLNHIGAHQISGGHAEAAGSHLLDARHFFGAVAFRVFAAFAGIGIAAQAVHRHRQRFVRFGAERADRHGGAVEAFEQVFRRLNFIQRNRRAAFGFQAQHIADGGGGALVDGIAVEAVFGIIAAVAGRLQGVHHFGVVGMVFALRFEFEQAAGIDIHAAAPSAFAGGGNLLVQVGKRCAFYAAGDAGEAEVHQFAVHAHHFKQARATVRRYARNAHFRHDFVQTFVDAVAEIRHHHAQRLGNRTGVYHVRQALVSQIRIHCSRAQAD